MSIYIEMGIVFLETGLVDLDRLSERAESEKV